MLSVRKKRENERDGVREREREAPVFWGLWEAFMMIDGVLLSVALQV